MAVVMAVTERTMKNIELRVNDVIHLENSIRELNTMMLTTAKHVHTHVRASYISTVCPEKRDQNVFGNVSDKIWAILMKFDIRFPE